MRNWTEEEVRRIVPADDLHVAPLRDDGFTHGMPNRIWAIVLDGNLYSHACNGTASRGYGAALRQLAGRASVAGSTFDIAFGPVDVETADCLDAAYRREYRGNPYLDSMVSERARSAVRIDPAPVDG